MLLPLLFLAHPDNGTVTTGMMRFEDVMYFICVLSIPSSRQSFHLTVICLHFTLRAATVLAQYRMTRPACNSSVRYNNNIIIEIKSC